MATGQPRGMVVCFDEWRVAVCLADVSRQVRAVLHGPFVEERGGM
jgi:hypothetical protein